MGQFYRPTRISDVWQWVKTCDTCKTGGKLQKSDFYNPIMQFQLFDMINYVIEGQRKQ